MFAEGGSVNFIEDVGRGGFPLCFCEPVPVLILLSTFPSTCFCCQVNEVVSAFTEGVFLIDGVDERGRGGLPV